MTCGGTPGKPGSWRKVVPLTEPNQKTSAGVVMYGGSRCPGCPDCDPCELCGGKGARPAAVWGWAWPCPRCEGSGVEPKDLGGGKMAGRVTTDRVAPDAPRPEEPPPKTDPPPPARESTEEPDFLDEVIAERAAENPKWEPSDARTRTDPARSERRQFLSAEGETWVTKAEADRLRAELREAVHEVRSCHAEKAAIADSPCRCEFCAALEGSEPDSSTPEGYQEAMERKIAEGSEDG